MSETEFENQTNPDPNAEAKAAFARGEKIEWLRKGEWAPCLVPQWYSNLQYRVAPVAFDPNADVKAAHARGERIEYLTPGQKWETCTDPFWIPGVQYRVAPKTLAEKNAEDLADLKEAREAIRKRSFGTGAFRDTNKGKLDYEACLSPLALREFVSYQMRHNATANREPDNWQLGIPQDEYLKSGYRHFMDWWRLHRSGKGNTQGCRDAVSALFFNLQGFMHESLKLHPPAE